MRYFTNIKNIYPKFDKFGDFLLLTKKVERNYDNENFDQEFELSFSGLVENTTYENNKEYCYLLNNDGKFILSNSNSMLKFYKPYLDEINGETLFFGLGLGLLILPLLNDPSVTKIDIVEIDANVIDYVYNKKIKPLDINNKINIINQNAFNFTTTNTYDYILIDIWSEKNQTAINDMNFLKDKFITNLNENGAIRLPLLNL
jgi:spermidine synthase